MKLWILHVTTGVNRDAELGSVMQIYGNFWRLWAPYVQFIKPGEGKPPYLNNYQTEDEY